MTKIDSRDYEAGEPLTTKEAIKWMVDGNVAISENVKGTVYHFDDDKGFRWVDKNGAFGFGVHFTSTVEPVWRKAILKRKAISWEDAVRALLDGKRVWDAEGDEWIKARYGFVWGTASSDVGVPNSSLEPFYLTPPPAVINVSTATNGVVEAPKPRRKVSREDAICAMVRDSEQHAYSDRFEYKWSSCDLCIKVRHTDGTWVGNCSMDTSFPIYLDPPEVK